MLSGTKWSLSSTQKYITGRELGGSWLAADEDGVMADHVVFDEEVVVKLPDHLDFVSAATIPCA